MLVLHRLLLFLFPCYFVLSFLGGRGDSSRRIDTAA